LRGRPPGGTSGGVNRGAEVGSPWVRFRGSERSQKGLLGESPGEWLTDPMSNEEERLTACRIEGRRDTLAAREAAEYRERASRASARAHRQQRCRPEPKPATRAKVRAPIPPRDIRTSGRACGGA